MRKIYRTFWAGCSLFLFSCAGGPAVHIGISDPAHWGFQMHFEGKDEGLLPFEKSGNFVTHPPEDFKALLDAAKLCKGFPKLLTCISDPESRGFQCHDSHNGKDKFIPYEQSDNFVGLPASDFKAEIEYWKRKCKPAKRLILQAQSMVKSI